MSAHILEEAGAVLIQDPGASVRSQAIAHANRLRALARAALSDGMPKAELRAANARSAARGVLRHARRISALCPSEIVPTDQTPASDRSPSTVPA